MSNGCTMQLSVFTSDTPLSKTFRRGQDGSLEKLAGGKLVRGFVKREAFLDLEGFSKFISGLNGVNALAYGIPKHDEARVLSRKESGSEKGGDLPVIHRTRESFTWPQGEGVFMLDHDVRKDRSVILSQEELLDAITKACPALSSAPMLLTHSASSHIYEDGKLIQGQAGMRIYVRVKDATDIPRAGAALYKRLWLAGFGFIEIGQSGAIYERSLIDASVWTPERLDFAGGAHCEPPYSQCRPDHVLMNEDFEAEAFDTGLIKDLTEREEGRFKNLVWNAKQQAKGAADQKRSEWLLSLPEDRRGVVEASLESGTLPADFVLTSVNGEEFTVKEALADKEKYHGIYVQHPFEPDYQPDNEKLAQLKLDSNPRPCVHTFAHGGQNFWLDTAEAAFEEIEAVQVEDDDWPRPAGSYEGTPPETEWIVDGWIPKGDAVLFTGEGGIGKSLLMMQLEAHVASGRTFLGNIVEQCKVLHVLCEDDDREIHRRYDRIRRSPEFAFTPDDVARMGSELQFWSRVGKDAIMCAAEGNLVHTKPFFDKLKRAIDRMGYGHKLLVLDTLADVFAGNENDRSQVNQFVKNYIMNLARNHDCTPVIIGHPPKSGAEYSGSTAWNGAVRSRMYMAPHEKKTMADEYRVLHLPKSNRGKSGLKITVKYDKGIFSFVNEVEVVDVAEEHNLNMVMDAVIAYAHNGTPIGLANTSKVKTKDLTIKGHNGENLEPGEIRRLIRILIDKGDAYEKTGTKYENGVWPMGGN